MSGLLLHLLLSPFILSISFLSAPSKLVQRRALFDSVSLVIQGSMEGELSLMDNLSGSICHFYALPPRPSQHSTDKKVNTSSDMAMLSLPLCLMCPAGLVSLQQVIKRKLGFILNGSQHQLQSTPPCSLLSRHLPFMLFS